MVDAASSRSVRGIIAVIAIFALGIVFGVALSFVISQRFGRPDPLGPPRGGPVPVERMARELDLDAAQREQVRAILERGHETMRGFLDEKRVEIRAVLRPDQQEKFDRMRPEGPRHGPRPFRGGRRGPAPPD